MTNEEFLASITLEGEEMQHTTVINGCTYLTTNLLSINKSKNACPTLGLLCGSARH